MGKKWDYDVPAVEVWAECLRVLKPGGHLLAFAGTRTQHRMAVRIEDAGFEIRDLIAWVYGSGFPKSLDVSKAIDGKMTTGRSDSMALREVNETRPGEAAVRPTSTNGHRGIVGSADAGPSIKRSAPATPEAQQWSGWGTALKPSLEPITVARKPLSGTVAENVLRWGTGGINVDGCRVGAGDGYTENTVTQGINTARTSYDPRQARRTFEPSSLGRWPANLIHDGSDEPCELLGDSARFFYTAKASRQDREHGNAHPTVKPTDLMRYLCRLVTPPGGIVLDPFTGSGSTGKAAMLEGFDFIGIERDADSFATAERRIGRAAAAGHQPDLFGSHPP